MIGLGDERRGIPMKPFIPSPIITLRRVPASPAQHANRLDTRQVLIPLSARSSFPRIEFLVR
jgi:hypothetical protein